MLRTRSKSTDKNLDNLSIFSLRVKPKTFILIVNVVSESRFSEVSQGKDFSDFTSPKHEEQFFSS